MHQNLMPRRLKQVELIYIRALTAETKTSAVDPAVRAKRSALHSVNMKQPQPVRQGGSVGMAKL